jgi:peptidyl-prolyl cis-trans isomerase B (cyclophilin B)
MKNRQKEVEAAQKDFDFSKNNYQLTFTTNRGDIRLNLYPDVAPGHVKNLLGLAKIGYYDGLSFHRIVKGFVIQGGCPSGTGTGGPGYTIDAEFNEKLHNPGTLSMARTSDPNSAGSQFFLCLERVPYLDRQYTVFGDAADQESIETIQAIGRSKTGPNDKPVEPIIIEKATVIEQPL